MIGFRNKEKYGYLFAKEEGMVNGNRQLKMLAFVRSDKQVVTNKKVDLSVISEMYVVARNYNKELINGDYVLLFAGEITSETSEKYVLTANKGYGLKNLPNQTFNCYDLDLKQPLAFRFSKNDSFVVK